MHQSAKAVRKPTNISLPIDLCTAAKDIGINISQVCETALREVVEAAKRDIWATENAEFIAENNRRVEAEGTLLQEWNTF